MHGPHFGPPHGPMGPHFGPPPPMYGRPYGYGPHHVHDPVVCCCIIN